MRSLSPGLKLFGFAAVALMAWSASSRQGPFQWALDWQAGHFGSTNAALAFLGPLALVGLVLFVKHRANMIYQDPAKLAALSQKTRRQGAWVAKLGWLALAGAAVSGGLGYSQLQVPPTVGEMNILAGDAAPPATDLARVTALAMTNMTVVFDENPKGNGDRWTYIPLLPAAASPATPIRYFLKTKQVEWIANDGRPEAARPLHRGTPPFVMTTQPAQLRSYGFPKEMRANFERAGLKIDDHVMVVQQSAEKDLTLYWGFAILGVILAFSCGRVWARTKSRADAAERRALRMARTA